MKGPVIAIAAVVALAIPAAAGAASWPTTEPTKMELPNLTRTADKNEVAVEGAIARPILEDLSLN
jgi:hypothetical protein